MGSRHADIASVEGIEFRNALSRWASGVSVICAAGPDGPIGITVSSFASLSLDPPLVLACIGNGWSGLDALTDAPGFSVHLLGEGQEDVSNRFAGSDDKFAGLDWEAGPFGAPLLAFGLARLVCAHESAIPCGDHTILVGRVVEARLRGSVDEPPDPLVHYARSYRRLAPAAE
jgi:flavin reductase (DIM6/NTAB) family NADH-FMN oxidoreductase RutF